VILCCIAVNRGSRIPFQRLVLRIEQSMCPQYFEHRAAPNSLILCGLRYECACRILGEFLVGNFLAESILIRLEVLNGFSGRQRRLEISGLAI